jgi:hypothetical protein
MSTVAEQGRQRTAPRGTLFALVSHAIRMQLKYVIIWGAGLGLYSTAMVALFTAIEGSAAQLNRLMEAYPKDMLGAFGTTDLGIPPTTCTRSSSTSRPSSSRSSPYSPSRTP